MNSAIPSTRILKKRLTLQVGRFFRLVGIVNISTVNCSRGMRLLFGMGKRALL